MTKRIQEVQYQNILFAFMCIRVVQDHSMLAQVFYTLVQIELINFNTLIILVLSVKYLQKKMEVTDEQLDRRINEVDLPLLAACFDNAEDYVEKLELTCGEQTDVRKLAFLHGTQAGMKIALKYWKSRNPMTATFRALLIILLSLSKGEIAIHAIQLCKCLSSKCELCGQCFFLINTSLTTPIHMYQRETTVYSRFSLIVYLPPPPPHFWGGGGKLPWFSVQYKQSVVELVFVLPASYLSAMPRLHI